MRCFCSSSTLSLVPPSCCEVSQFIVKEQGCCCCFCFFSITYERIACRCCREPVCSLSQTAAAAAAALRWWQQSSGTVFCVRVHRSLVDGGLTALCCHLLPQLLPPLLLHQPAVSSLHQLTQLVLSRPELLQTLLVADVG